MTVTVTGAVTGAAAPAVATTGAGEFRSRPWRRLRLHDLPVRGKLFAALAVPMAAFLAVAILAGVTWLSDAASYGHGVTSARLGRDVTAAVHEMQLERDLAAGFIMSGRGAAPTSRALADRLNTEQRVVDKVLTRFQASLGSSSGRLGRGASPLSVRVRQSIAALPALRQAVRGGKLPIGAILSEYSTTISRLLAFDRRIGQDRDDDELRYATTVLNDLSTIKEINSQIRGQLYAAALTGRFEFGAAERMSGLLAEEQTAQDAFRAAARPSDRTRYDQIVNGQAVLTVKRTSDRAIQRQRLPDLGIDPDQWFAASTTHIELLRTVETGLLDDVIGSASDLRSTAWERTAILGALIIIIMAGAIVWTLAIARTMTGPLRRLRTGALDVAHERLPRLIEQL
ncbi:nitrate- and nitrite sensing domain-containing protein, partial [Frankia sp. KB5]|uniref:nitrate- and nitrite sensing domain-containing protein n=2 Tax=unclassified Frankia TaxID=2632575 RepID=UPI001F5300B1